MKLLALFLIAIPMSAQTANYGANGAYKLPDPKVTPGAVNPNVVADLSGAPHMVNGVEMNMCAKDFRTGPIRATIKNFPKIKQTACTAYGVAKCDASVEGDHLISIEIGGCQDCQTNVWPQPMSEAKVKDFYVEDKLPKAVCAGKLTLSDAQQCIATDWVACGKKWGDLK